MDKMTARRLTGGARGDGQRPVGRAQASLADARDEHEARADAADPDPVHRAPGSAGARARQRRSVPTSTSTAPLTASGGVRELGAELVEERAGAACASPITRIAPPSAPAPAPPRRRRRRRARPGARAAAPAPPRRDERGATIAPAISRLSAAGSSGRRGRARERADVEPDRVEEAEDAGDPVEKPAGADRLGMPCQRRSRPRARLRRA